MSSTKACRYYFWRDFEEYVSDSIFPNADSVTIKEEGSYDFSFSVEEDGETTEYDSNDIQGKWYLVEDVPVSEFVVDHGGVWVIYDKEVDLF